MSSLVKCPFRSFADFLIRLSFVGFVVLVAFTIELQEFLVFLDMNLLLDIWLTSVSFHLLDCLSLSHFLYCVE